MHKNQEISVSLPYSSILPVNSLASIFDQVTNSYKFYWFLAILEAVRDGEGRILPTKKLLARMTARVWYPINYYKLSFGKQDQLGNIVAVIMERIGLSIESSYDMIVKTTLHHLQRRDEVGRQVAFLANYVPYRFLRPFFAENLRSEQDWKINRHIREMAEQAFNSRQPCLYRFVNSPEPAIEIHPEWFKYFQQHLTILTGFCLWHLINYLQKHNPNVPNLPGKLFEPQSRDLKMARLFWNQVLKQSNPLICIYSSKPILPGNFSIDHFLPWRFVGHDLLWNLIPTPKEVNASKSDNLPDPSYLEPFAKMQYQAVQSIVALTRAERMLEDYVILFKVSSINEFRRMSLSHFTDTIQATIAPQLQIAANMGFSQCWRYIP